MSTLVFLRKAGYGTTLRDAGFNTVRSDQKRKFRRLNPDIIWRWGYSGSMNNVALHGPIINESEFIRQISDKWNFLQQCYINDIRVPNFTNNYHNTEEWFDYNPADTIVLGRDFNHSGGQDIINYQNYASISVADRKSDFYVKYIPKSREYRIYTFFGKVLYIQEKIPEDRNQIAWNHRQGSHFEVVRRNNWPSKACYFAVKAANLTGIDFCAFDIILGQDGKFYMLEGNTAPSITGDYGIVVIEECVNYLENYFNGYGHLPEHFNTPTEYIKGYENYIHPLMLEGD